MKMTAIGPFELYQKVTTSETLTNEEQREWNSVKERLETICKASFDADKPIYIDAEETWIQQAIDDLAEEMMSRYNRSKSHRLYHPSTVPVGPQRLFSQTDPPRLG